MIESNIEQPEAEPLVV